jgi:hypothetical protein
MVCSRTQVALAHFAERRTPEEEFRVSKQAVLDPVRENEREMGTATKHGRQPTGFHKLFPEDLTVSKVEALVGCDFSSSNILVVFVILGGVNLWLSCP